METEEIKIGERTIKVRELLADEFDSTLDLKDTNKRLREMIKISTGMNEEEYSKLTVRERTKILEVVNRLNGWTQDFRNTQTEGENTSETK